MDTAHLTCGKHPPTGPQHPGPPYCRPVGRVGGSTTIEPWLREILRGPACRSELRDATGESGPELVCTSDSCGLAYRIEDGVPVLLVDEARRPA